MERRLSQRYDVLQTPSSKLDGINPAQSYFSMLQASAILSHGKKFVEHVEVFNLTAALENRREDLKRSV